MEDSHSHILSLPDDPETTWFSVFGKNLKFYFCFVLNFSIIFLDGHGGSIVAKYASKHLHKYVIQRPEFPENIPEALRQVRIEEKNYSITLDL
jgi:protein phosphatase 2C family protein 2/3